MMKKFLYVALLLLPLATQATAQHDTLSVDVSTDEMADAIEQPIDTADIEYRMIEMANLVDQSIGTPEALVYADELEDLAREAGSDKMIRYAITSRITAHHAMSDYDGAIRTVDENADVFEMSSHDDIYATYVKSLCYMAKGMYKLATQTAQRMYEKGKNGEYLLHLHNAQDPSATITANDSLVDVRAMVNAQSLIGMVSFETKLFDDAISKFTDAMVTLEQLDPNNRLFTARIELQYFMAMAASKLPDRHRAISYFDLFQAEIDAFNTAKIGTDAEAANIDDYQCYLYIIKASAYCDLGEYAMAYDYMQQADALIAEYGFVDQFAAELNGVKSKYYSAMNNWNIAIAYADSAINFYKETQSLNNEYESLRHKLDALFNSGQHARVYDVATRMLDIKDTLSDQRFKSSLEEMQTIMSVDKLELANQSLEAKQRMWVFIALTIVLAAVIGFILFKRKRDREKQRILSAQKQMLEEEVARQTLELREQKAEIEQKNRDITDSINYAQRIQKSILPEFQQYEGCGMEAAFALFIPCHIVSGDFYWSTRRDNIIWFACADCTGHGVPGAFMSMIGTTILNDLCKRQDLLAPNELLEQLHINLLAVLQQSGERDSRDGMDISVMEYNIDTHTVRVSSARRPVYLFLGGELQEYKGAKRSIGERDYTQETLPFTIGEYTVTSGDTIYMCSDGLPDQFGGPTEGGKRLKSGGLVKMLKALYEMPIGEQHAAVEKMYYDWRGDCPQFDDISLVGVRF